LDLLSRDVRTRLDLLSLDAHDSPQSATDGSARGRAKRTRYHGSRLILAACVVREKFYILLSSYCLGAIGAQDVSVSRKDEGIILKTRLWRHTQHVCVLLAMIVMVLMGSQVSYAATFAAVSPQNTALDGPGAL